MSGGSIVFFLIIRLLGEAFKGIVGSPILNQYLRCYDVFYHKWEERVTRNNRQEPTSSLKEHQIKEGWGFEEAVATVTGLVSPIRLQWQKGHVIPEPFSEGWAKIASRS